MSVEFLMAAPKLTRFSRFAPMCVLFSGIQVQTLETDAEFCMQLDSERGNLLVDSSLSRLGARPLCSRMELARWCVPGCCRSQDARSARGLNVPFYLLSQWLDALGPSTQPVCVFRLVMGALISLLRQWMERCCTSPRCARNSLSLPHCRSPSIGSGADLCIGSQPPMGGPVC